MKIEFLYAEKIAENILRVFIEINGETHFFIVSESMFLNDIDKRE